MRGNIRAMNAVCRGDWNGVTFRAGYLVSSDRYAEYTLGVLLE